MIMSMYAVHMEFGICGHVIKRQVRASFRIWGAESAAVWVLKPVAAMPLGAFRLEAVNLPFS